MTPAEQTACLYKALELPVPEQILCCDSPLAALKEVRSLWVNQGRDLFSGPDPSLFHALMKCRERIRKGYSSQFPDPSWRSTRRGAQLLGRSKLVQEALRGEFKDYPELVRVFQFDAQIWRGDDFELRQPMCLNSDGVAETIYEVSKLAKRGLSPELQLLQEWSGKAGFLWPFDRVAVVSGLPENSEYDKENRLHCETGPAVRYQDNWRIWALKGRQVPRDLIECPERLTEDDLLAMEDLQLRRWMLQRRGLPVHNPRLQKLKRMVDRAQFYRFDKRHIPPRAQDWPAALPVPVPPNRPSQTPPDGVYFRLFEDGQLQLVAWSEKEQMIYLRLDQGKASGYFHVHLGGEQYFEDGRMEDFSPWDDDSPPYFVEQSFEDWVRASLVRFPGLGREVYARG
ncbi:MAG: hypothetical protein KF760_08400 [Candidatus Eremiobacteraeota bacterium]|nr:hypothetical protein [Candidatus Eremiobacteraeota bacterium]MCW5870893.1 hypothetical protein [Candidatus Eremiobacteraeota bacterium]